MKTLLEVSSTNIILTASALLVGILLGVLIGRRGARQKPVGYLRVDHSDGDGPYLFLELGTDVGTITQREYVTLRVKVEDFLPHE